MDWTLVSGVVGGLGLGTLINSLYTSYSSQKSVRVQRLYGEKRDAYIGLLNALHVAAISPSNESSKNYALWQTKCSLFGSKDVIEAAQMIVETNDNRKRRDIAFDSLLNAMRKDLNDL